jgi:hypothetical protein
MCRERHIIYSYREGKQMSPLWKSIKKLIKNKEKKLKIAPHNDPAIQFWGIAPK